MEAKERPASKFCQQLANIVRTIESDIKIIPGDIQNFISCAKALTDTVKKEEEKRPIAYIGDSLTDKEIKLDRKIDAQRKRDHEALIARDTELSSIEAQLATLHSQINEMQNDEVLDGLTSLVKNYRIQLSIDETLGQEIEADQQRSCCTRYIFCCFLSKDEKLAKQKLARLDQEKKKLNSTDAKTKHDAIRVILMKKRETLEVERKIVESRLLPSADEKTEDQLLGIERDIESKKNKFYSAISNKLMFEIIQIKILYDNILHELMDSRLTITPTSSTPLIDPNQSLKNLFINSTDVIENLLGQLWCPYSDNKNGIDIFNDSLSLLPAETRKKNLDKKLIDVVVAYQAPSIATNRDYYFLAPSPAIAVEHVTMRIS